MLRIFNCIKQLIWLVFACYLGSCQQHKQNNIFSKQSFAFVKMDTLKTNNSVELQKQKYNSLAYEDIAIGSKILLSSIPKEVISREQIRDIISIGVNYEKYDTLGYLTYEKWNEWSSGRHYTYHFDKKGNPIFLLISDEADTIKYKYDQDMNLVACGNLAIKYYPNGFKRSVENEGEIETYEYDVNGNICHINFDIKPGGLYCGNRIKEWFGAYDKNNKLIRDLKIGFPFTSIKVYEYSEHGDLFRLVDFNELTKDTLAIISYIYKDRMVIIDRKQKK